MAALPRPLRSRPADALSRCTEYAAHDTSTCAMRHLLPLLQRSSSLVPDDDRQTFSRSQAVNESSPGAAAGVRDAEPTAAVGGAEPAVATEPPTAASNAAPAGDAKATTAEQAAVTEPSVAAAKAAPAADAASAAPAAAKGKSAEHAVAAPGVPNGPAKLAIFKLPRTGSTWCGSPLCLPPAKMHRLAVHDHSARQNGPDIGISTLPFFFSGLWTSSTGSPGFSSQRRS